MVEAKGSRNSFGIDYGRKYLDVRLWHLKEAVKAEDSLHRRRLININYHLLGCDMTALSTADYELPKPSDLGEESPADLFVE